MVAVPADTPVTMPLPVPIVATVVALLVQLPPPVASVNVVVNPEQTLVVPEIPDGNGLTVKVVEDIHPVARV